MRRFGKTMVTLFMAATISCGASNALQTPGSADDITTGLTIIDMPTHAVEELIGETILLYSAGNVEEASQMRESGLYLREQSASMEAMVDNVRLMLFIHFVLCLMCLFIAPIVFCVRSIYRSARSIYHKTRELRRQLREEPSEEEEPCPPPPRQDPTEQVTPEPSVTYEDDVFAQLVEILDYADDFESDVRDQLRRIVDDTESLFEGYLDEPDKHIGTHYDLLHKLNNVLHLYVMALAYPENYPNAGLLKADVERAVSGYAEFVLTAIHRCTSARYVGFYDDVAALTKLGNPIDTKPGSEPDVQACTWDSRTAWGCWN